MCTPQNKTLSGYTTFVDFQFTKSARHTTKPVSVKILFRKLSSFKVRLYYNYQHFSKESVFVWGRVGKPLFRCKKCQHVMHEHTQTQAWLKTQCGEVASLGCVEDRAGRWEEPPSVHHTPLLPSLSGARPISLSSSSVGDLTAVNNWIWDGFIILALLLLLPFPPPTCKSGSSSCMFCSSYM